MFSEQSQILLITYKFPPIKTIGTIRNYNVAQQFSKHFAAVHVVTTSNRDFLPQESLPFSEAPPIYPVGTFDYRTLLRPLIRRRQSLMAGKHIEQPALDALLRLKDTFPFLLLLDEGGLAYILLAYRRCRQLIREHGIRYIYSSFRPYADHLVAYLLKLWDPSLVWIADFRDPHVDLNWRNVYFTGLQHRVNRRLLAKADVLTTVSQGLSDYLRRYGRPVYVLRNSINPVFQSFAREQPPSAFTISYTGSIYPHRQRAGIFLNALAGLIQRGLIPKSQIRLRYAGKDSQVWSRWVATAGLEDIAHTTATVDLREAINIQYNSHINLLLSWSGPYIQGILTGKLYEYFASRRPILALINGGRDAEFESIFEELNAGMVAYCRPEEQERVADFLLRLFRQWQAHGDIDWPYRLEALRHYEWDEQMERFIAYLRERVGVKLPARKAPASR
jgi:hypothetical protein